LERAQKGWFYGAMSQKLKGEEHLLVEQLFTYRPPDAEQIEQLGNVRNAAKGLAHVIMENCPKSADRTAAIRKLREAVMTADASIVLRGVS
jgi:hypothetical protein